MSKALFIFIEHSDFSASVVVSCIRPTDDNWDAVDKNSFRVPVPKGFSSEAILNIVTNTLRNGTTEAPTIL